MHKNLGVFPIDFLFALYEINLEIYIYIIIIIIRLLLILKIINQQHNINFLISKLRHFLEDQMDLQKFSCMISTSKKKKSSFCMLFEKKITVNSLHHEPTSENCSTCGKFYNRLLWCTGGRGSRGVCS